jgi:putative endonuclease
VNKLGVEAEIIAANYLLQQGLSLIASNYSCRYGEIDLVMRDGKTLVFVEVRMRSNSSFGGAGNSITASKQLKLSRTAEHYLQQHGDINNSMACRFDAVLMQKPSVQDIEWIRNAFEI